MKNANTWNWILVKLQSLLKLSEHLLKLPFLKNKVTLNFKFLVSHFQYLINEIKSVKTGKMRLN